MVIPDSIQPVTGWKALDVHHDGTLWSPQQHFHWPLQKKAVANCLREQHEWVPRPGAPPAHSVSTEIGFAFGSSATEQAEPDDDSPSAVVLPDNMHWSWEPVTHEAASRNDCTCGIYMVNDPRETIGYCGPHSVIAQITGWGHTIKGTKGARVQYAYPTLLIASPDMEQAAKLAAHHYNIPYQIWEPGKGIPDPSKGTRDFAANLAKAMKKAQASQLTLAEQAKLLNQTMQAIQPPPPVSGPTVLLPIAATCVTAACAVQIASFVFGGNNWYHAWVIAFTACALINVLGDFLIFNHREKQKGR